MKYLIMSGVMVAMASCPGTSVPQAQRHQAVVSVVSAHAVLSAIQDTEALLVCGRVSAPPSGCVPQATHLVVLNRLLSAFEYEKQLVGLVRAVPPGSPTTREIFGLLGQVQDLVDLILADIPPSALKANLVGQLGGQS